MVSPLFEDCFNLSQMCELIEPEVYRLIAISQRLLLADIPEPQKKHLLSSRLVGGKHVYQLLLL